MEDEEEEGRAISKRVRSERKPQVGMICIDLDFDEYQLEKVRQTHIVADDGNAMMIHNKHFSQWLLCRRIFDW